MRLEDIPNGQKINRSLVTPPRLFMTAAAWSQIQLIQDNDFTKTGLHFRIQIGGKECDGFTYWTGFSHTDEEDLLVEARAPQGEAHSGAPLSVLMDPFTAFYLKNVIVDFRFDPLTQNEGFVVNNLQQGDFAGKFWRTDDSKIPPLL